MKNRKFRKGDIVEVSAIVVTKQRYNHTFGLGVRWDHEIILRDVKERAPGQRGYSHGSPRPFCKYPVTTPFRGVVVGWSTRISGYHVMGHPASWEHESTPGDIEEAQVHQVILVCPMINERWTPPIACLEEDLRVVQILWRAGDE